MKKTRRTQFKRTIMYIFSLYTVFALFTSTMPYISPPNPDEGELQALPIYNIEARETTEYAGLIENTDEAFNLRLQMTDSAKETIDVVYHTIAEGDCSTMLLSHILDAAERGVNVRLLFDGTVGISGTQLRKDLQALNAHPNIECRIYNPLRLLQPWKWHSLLHDKFILVDGTMLVTGGRNIADKYYNPTGYRGKVTNDRDIFIWSPNGRDNALEDTKTYIDSLWESEDTVVLGDAVKEPERRFESIREEASIHALDNMQYSQKSLDDFKGMSIPVEGILFLSNPIHTNVKEPYIGHQLYRMMVDAKERVIIQTPYATKTDFLMDTLEDRREGTTLTILTNSMASSPNFPAFSNYYTNRHHFLKRGAEIFEYQNEHSIHGKSIIIDSDISIVGSFNMDARSLYIDTESMYVLKSREFTELLERAMNVYMAESRCICPDSCNHRKEIAELPVAAIKKVGMQLSAFLSNPLGFLI